MTRQAISARPYKVEPPRWNALMNNLGLNARDYDHLKIK
jgi:hypothetical protein